MNLILNLILSADFVTVRHLKQDLLITKRCLFTSPLQYIIPINFDSAHVRQAEAGQLYFAFVQISVANVLNVIYSNYNMFRLEL